MLPKLRWVHEPNTQEIICARLTRCKTPGVGVISMRPFLRPLKTNVSMVVHVSGCHDKAILSTQDTLAPHESSWKRSGCWFPYFCIFFPPQQVHLPALTPLVIPHCWFTDNFGLCSIYRLFLEKHWISLGFAAYFQVNRSFLTAFLAFPSGI